MSPRFQRGEIPCHERQTGTKTTQVEEPGTEIAGGEELFPCSKAAVILRSSQLIFWSQCIKKLQDVNEDFIKFLLSVPPQAAVALRHLQQWGINETLKHALVCSDELSV